MNLMYEILCNISNALSLAGSTFKDMLYFRSFLVAALIIECLYDTVYADKIQLSDFLWSAAIATMNLIQVVIIILERSRLSLNEMELKIYNQVFPQMNKVNFKKLIKDADWTIFPENSVLIEEDSLLDKLMLIYEGSVVITVKGRAVAHLRDGNFVGEMSFITGNHTTAEVKTNESSRIITWERTKLNALLEKYPDTSSDLQKILNRDLIQKVITRNNEQTS